MRIAHDGMARYELHKVRYNTAPHTQTCSWCGGTDKRGNVYTFGTVPDDRLSGRLDRARGKFCSVSCYRTYHS
jgi:hypothetical protein